MIAGWDAKAPWSDILGLTFPHELERQTLWLPGLWEGDRGGPECRTSQVPGPGIPDPEGFPDCKAKCYLLLSQKDGLGGWGTGVGVAAKEKEKVGKEEEKEKEREEKEVW